MFIVSFSGNSGAGKSTMLRNVGLILRPLFGDRLHLLDETIFHHPHLARMFEDPKNWAFPIQINFILQRSLTLLRLVETAPASLVMMERSLDEDELFFSYHESSKSIPKTARAAYEEVHHYLKSRLPAVSCYVYLEDSIEQLVARVEERTRQCRCGKELTGPALVEYITAMNEGYSRWAERKRSNVSRDYLWIEGEKAANVEYLAGVISRSFHEELGGEVWKGTEGSTR